MSDDTTKQHYNIGDKLIATDEYCVYKVHNRHWTQDEAQRALEQEGVINFVSKHGISVCGDGWSGSVTDFVIASRMRNAWLAKNGGQS